LNFALSTLVRKFAIRENVSRSVVQDKDCLIFLIDRGRLGFQKLFVLFHCVPLSTQYDIAELYPAAAGLAILHALSTLLRFARTSELL
jgi:hypothetical protein